MRLASSAKNSTKPARVDDLALGLGQRLALLAGEQQRQLVGVLDDQVEPAAQDAWSAPWPAASTRPAARSAASIAAARLGLAKIGHAGDDLAGGLVGDGQLGLADPLAPR